MIDYIRPQLAPRTIESVGADARSSNFYLRTKGEAEAAVRACGYLRVDIARPSFLLGPRAEAQTGERVGIVAAKMVAPLLIGPLMRQGTELRCGLEAASAEAVARLLYLLRIRAVGRWTVQRLPFAVGSFLVLIALFRDLRGPARVPRDLITRFGLWPDFSRLETTADISAG